MSLTVENWPEQRGPLVRRLLDEARERLADYRAMLELGSEDVPAELREKIIAEIPDAEALVARFERMARGDFSDAA